MVSFDLVQFFTIIIPDFFFLSVFSFGVTVWYHSINRALRSPMHLITCGLSIPDAIPLTKTTRCTSPLVTIMHPFASYPGYCEGPRQAAGETEDLGSVWERDNASFKISRNIVWDLKLIYRYEERSFITRLLLVSPLGATVVEGIYMQPLSRWAGRDAIDNSDNLNVGLIT